jgi:hypothetical protein
MVRVAPARAHSVASWQLARFFETVAVRQFAGGSVGARHGVRQSGAVSARRSAAEACGRHPLMADTIAELLVIEAAVDKLGERGISVDEAQQLADNRYIILRNPGASRRSPQQHRARRLVVGDTDGGRMLTLVVERTVEPTTWLVVTGWEATPAERRMVPDR